MKNIATFMLVSALILGVLHRGRGCRVGGPCSVQCIRPCAPPAENEVKGVFA